MYIVDPLNTAVRGALWGAPCLVTELSPGKKQQEDKKTGSGEKSTLAGVAELADAPGRIAVPVEQVQRIDGLRTDVLATAAMALGVAFIVVGVIQCSQNPFGAC